MWISGCADVVHTSSQLELVARLSFRVNAAWAREIEWPTHGVVSLRLRLQRRESTPRPCSMATGKTETVCRTGMRHRHVTSLASLDGGGLV